MPTHVLSGRRAGLSDDQITHLGDAELPESIYTPQALAVIRYARASTTMSAIDDNLYLELRSFFSVAALIELCFTIGSANMVNRFHATFHTPLDDDTRDALSAACPLPLPVPPPEPQSPERGPAAPDVNPGKADSFHACEGI